jgi:hypothetical protein
MKLNNDLCLPNPLPVDGGVADCRILLADVDGGCGRSGLSDASDADLSAVNIKLQEQGGAPLTTLCVLRQLTAGSGPACVAQSDPGWCYVNGSCSGDAGTSCQQTLCTTDGLASSQSTYKGTWLACP